MLERRRATGPASVPAGHFPGLDVGPIRVLDHIELGPDATVRVLSVEEAGSPNPLPIHRLRRDPGEAQAIQVLYVTFPALKPARQRCTRLPGWDDVLWCCYASQRFEATLPVDRGGLARRPGIWRRVKGTGALELPTGLPGHEGQDIGCRLRLRHERLSHAVARLRLHPQ